MISTKIQPLNGQLRNPFSSSQSVYAGLSSSFSQFRNTLQSQLHILKRKFPQEDTQKIKDLLEEFDSNIQMVTQILISSQDKQQMVCQKPVSRKVEVDDEVKILKNAVARLYKKLIQQQKQMQTLKICNQRAKKENEDLKLQNRLLLEREFGNNSFEEERQVF